MELTSSLTFAAAFDTVTDVCCCCCCCCCGGCCCDCVCRFTVAVAGALISFRMSSLGDTIDGALDPTRTRFSRGKSSLEETVAMEDASDCVDAAFVMVVVSEVVSVSANVVGCRLRFDMYVLFVC